MNAMDVINGTATWSIEQADCLPWLRSLPPKSVDLVFGSPPYEEARLYLEGGANMGISRKTDEWVAWMTEVFVAAQAACKGLVAMVVAGQTRQYRWSAGPALLMASLRNAGLNLRNPPIFKRVGIPGSGGPDWLRGDYEWIVCTSQKGKLPWSDNVAMGHTPKWAPGGDMSHRLSSGARVNQWGHPIDSGGTGGGSKDDVTSTKRRPSHKLAGGKRGIGRATRGSSNGDVMHSHGYDPPAKANPGNVVECIVGGGVMGDKLCHENEAPFPEKLAEFFVRSFAPEGGLVADCFSGSGTTAAVALMCGRRAVACDMRDSQVQLGRKRVGKVTSPLFVA